uniref:Uncharacterized protein n=1 Tax=Clastoptera arizonana TaxID=38151 RepID=A0A1B6CRA3_9HEMI
MLFANRKNPFDIVQMQKSDFFDFQEQARHFNYQNCPFIQVTQLEFNADNPLEVKYKTSHLTKIWSVASLQFLSSSRKKDQLVATIDRFQNEVKNIKTVKKLPEDKVKDIKTMMKWMPAVDVNYLKAVLN